MEGYLSGCVYPFMEIFMSMIYVFSFVDEIDVIVYKLAQLGGEVVFWYNYIIIDQWNARDNSLWGGMTVVGVITRQ